MHMSYHDSRVSVNIYPWWCVTQKEADTPRPISATVPYKYNTLTGLLLAFSLGCGEGELLQWWLCQKPQLCISGQSTAAVIVDRGPAGADPTCTSTLWDRFVQSEVSGTMTKQWLPELLEYCIQHNTCKPCTALETASNTGAPQLANCWDLDADHSRWEPNHQSLPAEWRHPD